MKQGYRFRAFTASYSWAARHFSADTFSCSENPSLNSLMWTGRMAPCNEHKSLLLFEHQKTRHNLDWTRTSISELSVRHSAIELHLQSEDNLFAISVFLWSGIPESHRWLLHGKETSCCYTKPAISSKHSWLFRTCCCYNKEYSIIVVGAPTGFCHQVYGLEGHHSASELWVQSIKIL